MPLLASLLLRSVSAIGRRVGAGLLLLAAACGSREPTGVAFTGATLIDGRGTPPQRNVAVVVRGSRIEAVLPMEQFSLPDETTAIDAQGLVIIPGLVDAHVHTPRWALPRFLAWGVTTVRDLHGATDSVFPLRQAIRTGAVAGPRLYVAGAMLDAPPTTYPDATPVPDADAGRRAVDDLLLEGADLAKLYTRIDQPAFTGIMEEARTLKLPVTAHLGLVDARTAARLGVKSLEHLSGIPEATLADPSALFAAHRAGFFAGWTAFERSWAQLDSAALARTAADLAATRVMLVPTLALHELFSRLGDSTEVSLPEFADMPAAELAAWNLPDMIRRAGWGPADYAAFRAARPKQDLFLREFVGAGGTVVAGTDATNQLLVPGAALHRELALLVRMGLSPVAAIQAATSSAAKLLGVDSIGVVAPGRVADLVVLAGDPATDIGATRKIRFVMQGGRLLSPDSIRAAWTR